MLAGIWHQQQAAGHDDNSFTVRLRPRLANRLQRGGRYGQAIWDTSRIWQEWTRARMRSPRQGTRIGVAYAQILVGCGPRGETDGLLFVQFVRG
ncbi:hypothetical protein [Actinoplanes sp. NPDC026670]|uniref:hypothetical protein n=1 Tax=Actinoplanes sp. NPDC026670 TaxID=3154700 RepID=UPI0033EC832E